MGRAKGSPTLTVGLHVPQFLAGTADGKESWGLQFKNFWRATLCRVPFLLQLDTTLCLVTSQRPNTFIVGSVFVDLSPLHQIANAKQMS